MSFNYDDVVKDTQRRIRQKSTKVNVPLSSEDKATLMDLLTYVRNSQDGELAQELNLRPAVGIAAIQIGIPKKMIAIVLPDDEDEEKDIEYALANPRIVSESVQRAYLKNGEGCLSVEDEHQGIVPRSARITVKGYDLLQDKDITIKASGYQAIVIQHELDHFNGVLFYDHINPEDPWKAIPQAQVIE